MPRPKRCRRIAEEPGYRIFKPAGVPASGIEELVLGLDELEAIRLADVEGLYQEDAAAEMNVSRQTFGRILASARRKVANALVNGKALRIKGGNIEMAEKRTFTCHDCGHVWELAYGTGSPSRCPECRSTNIHRLHNDRGRSGYGRGRGRRRSVERGSQRGYGRGAGRR